MRSAAELRSRRDAAHHRPLTEGATRTDGAGDRAVEEATRALGGLDVLVNNAVRFVFGHLKGAGNGSGSGTDRDVTASDVLLRLNAV